jgi:hypothetical protein
VHCVAELHHIAKKVGPVTEALQNTWHLLPAGFLTPLVIDVSHIASRVGVFNQLDLGLFIVHGADLTTSGYTMRTVFAISIFDRRLSTQMRD